MLLSVYIKSLQEIHKKYGDLFCVYSGDDEGNYYNEVKFSPSPCRFNIITRDCNFTGKGKLNAVCVN